MTAGGKAGARFADHDSSERFESGWNRLMLATEVVVGVVVFCGLVGLLGTGPFSTRTVAFAGAPLTMTYDHILRRTVASQLTVRATAPLARDDLTIELPQAFADDVDVVSTSPRSTLMRAEAGGVAYVFALGAARLGTVTFTIKPRVAGIIAATVDAGGARAALREFVLP